MLTIVEIIFIILCLLAFYFFCIRSGMIYDEKTNRFYRYAKESDNPHSAICPKCEPEYEKKEDALRPLIHSIYGDKKHHGIYCWFHGEVWFSEKED